MKYQKQIILAIGILVVISYHFFAYFGHYGYDDLHYAKLSAYLPRGIIDFNDHYSYRLPVLILTSICYLIFGINDASSSLPALFMSIGILFIIYLLLKDQDIYTLIIAFALCICSEWFLFYSDKLMPDMYLAFFQFAALYLIYRYKFHDSQQKFLGYGWSTGIAIFLGFLTKESVVLLFPVLAYFAISDLKRKVHLKFWLWSIVSLMLLFTLYLFAIKLLTGDLFKRFDTIFNNAYLNLCSYSEQSVQILIKRIFEDFFKMLVTQGMVIGLIIVLASQIKNKFNVFKLPVDSSNFWTVSTLLLVLSFNFMTISPTAYSPMCIDPRHYILLVPVAAVASAPVLLQFFRFRKYRIELMSLAMLLCVFAFFKDPNSFWKLYLPLFCLFAVISFSSNGTHNTLVYTLIFIGVLSIKPLDSVIYARKVNYNKQKQNFKEQIINSQNNCVIITDDVQSRLAEYYLAFKKSDIEITHFEAFQFDPSDSRKIFVYLNAHTQYLSGFKSSDRSYYLKDIHLHNKLIFENPELSISIYEMDKQSLEEEKVNKVLWCTNDFEKVDSHWVQDKGDISTQQAYSSSHSNRLQEYSSTFRLSLDSLDLSQAKTLVVEYGLYMLSHEPIKAGLVLSLENSGGVYHWESVDPNKFVKAYSNWWLVSQQTNIKVTDIKLNSVLKIYVWNQQKQEVYIDDVQIMIGTK